MTDTFNADKATDGTTTQDQGTVDNGFAEGNDVGTKLQQQIDVMQKRMGDKDTHISRIESENKVLQERLADIAERLEKMGTVEDALTRMKEDNRSNQATTLDEDTLKSTVKTLLAETTAEERAEANFKAVSDRLTGLYGKDKVDETVANVAKENGLTFSDMIALARKSPNAVYKMVGIQTVHTSVSPSQSTIAGSGTSTPSKEQKLAEYAKMRRENPKEFYRPETQRVFRELCLSK